MSIYIDADVLVRWERGEFDLPAWLEARGDEPAAFPATAWQQLLYGVFAWSPDRSAKRTKSLLLMAGLGVAPFSRVHAVRAAELAADLKLQTIGFADFQIAATALVDGAELLSFNKKHFERVPGLRLATV
jgi:predicted nucleic acid-binding protein